MPRHKLSSVSNYSAPALEKGIAILQCLADARTALTLSEISASLHRTPGEIFRMLAVLERESLVFREEESGRYRLGLRLAALAAASSPMDVVQRKAAVAMREFVRGTGQEIHLSVLEEGRLLVVCEEMGSGAVRLSVPGGSYHDPRHTLSGRILLTHLPEKERLQQLALAAMYFPNAQKQWEPVPVELAGKVHEEQGEVIAGFLDMAVWIHLPGFGPAVLTSTCPVTLAERDRKVCRRALGRAAEAILS